VTKTPKQEDTAEFKEQAVTEHGGNNFVAASERIAVFDNDGTPWAEPPAYFQAPFMAPTPESTVYPTMECA